jgi:hypothetical protein
MFPRFDTRRWGQLITLYIQPTGIKFEPQQCAGSDDREASLSKETTARCARTVCIKTHRGHTLLWGLKMARIIRRCICQSHTLVAWLQSRAGVFHMTFRSGEEQHRLCINMISDQTTCRMRKTLRCLTAQGHQSSEYFGILDRKCSPQTQEQETRYGRTNNENSMKRKKRKKRKYSVLPCGASAV